MIRERSGLAIDPLFSASKLRWLLQNIPDGVARAKAGELCAGTVDSWLLWNLTGGAVHATDSSNASRTQLLNLRANEWDPELLELFGIPRVLLPRVGASSGIAGFTSGSGRLAAGIPIGALIGDSHAALFGHAAFTPGMVKATYGTGSSLMSPMRDVFLSRRGLSTTVAWSARGEVSYALEGNITSTGATVDWLGKALRLEDGPAAVAELATTVEDSGGVYLVPAFAGLGAPHWDPHARGVICGLTHGTGSGQLARAAVESIAYQVADVFDAMRQDAGAAGQGELLADGGASRNNWLMQFQADVLGCPVVRNSSTDLSAVGTAWLAGLATGFWRDLEDLKSLPGEPDKAARFEPRMRETRREELLAGWREAVDLTSRRARE
jgi:glycerol kinase